ncbi:hypothetical protein [Veillonella seminalis]|uniref:hypothetical protein n=1 Tax=Veillonella seminalis TaxID=1502943 RepID=UPI00402AF158
MENKRLHYVLYAAIAVVLIIVCIGYYSNQKVTAPKVVPQSTMAKPEVLAKDIKITPKQADAVVHEIAKTKPVISYTVNAPTITQAADDTAIAINNKSPELPAVAVAPRDRTVIVANEDKQTVDVYKINLDKPHKIKTGVTVLNDKIYPTIGYQAGRVEGLVQFDGTKIKGATVMYTVAQW